MPERPEAWMVLALRTIQDTTVPVVEAVALTDEMEAHEVAQMVVALGFRSFLVNSTGDDGSPTVEEYHGTHGADECDIYAALKASAAGGQP